MNSKQPLSSCELPGSTHIKRKNTNRFYAYKGDFRWKGVKVTEYKSGGDNWKGIARQVLIGESGETTQFHLRYFEIEPGGFSSFETHQHEHVVISIRGTGKVRLERKHVKLEFLDVIYIKPGAPHRLYNPYDEPFGFFCIVNAERDKPVPAVE